MTIRAMSLAVLAGLVVFAGCGSGDKTGDKPDETASGGAAVEQRQEPDHVKVQHVLIAFQGTLPGKDVQRTREEAEKLAADLLAQAKAGADFDELVKQYTDDSYPGIYEMANLGIEANPQAGVYPRAGMVKGFGDVGFSLDVGEIGVAAYDPVNSKYGWHIIKRIE